MLAWVTLSVPTFTFSLASTACRDAQHQNNTNGYFYFQFCFCHTHFDFMCSCLKQACIQPESATPMASMVLFRWGLETNISNLYACKYIPDTGQPGVKLGFSLNWRRKAWSFLFFSTYQMNFHAANSLASSARRHSIWHSLVFWRHPVW